VLFVGPFEGRVARWWRPPRPHGLTAAGLATVAGELSRGVPDAPDPRVATAVAGLVGALATGAPPTGWVARLLGRGPGLTPLGDDVLAGALVTLGALGEPGFARLGAAVRELAPGRTTAVSVALLCHAARGECIPELDAVLTAARRGSPVAGAVDALLGVGGSSGTGLARGVLAALAVADRVTPAGSDRVTPAVADRATPAGSDRATPAGSDRVTLAGSDRAVPVP
jgi:hypothetical protein